MITIAVCSRCKGDFSRLSHRYCAKCQAEYMRDWRTDHPMSEAQKIKSRARSYANVYLRRGKIKKLACQKCGDPNTQMHHADYTKPLEVTWWCADCHQDEHGAERMDARRARRGLPPKPR